MHRTCKAWSLSKQDTKTLQVLSLDVFELEWFTASFRQFVIFKASDWSTNCSDCSKSENLLKTTVLRLQIPGRTSLHIDAYAKKSRDHWFQSELWTCVGQETLCRWATKTRHLETQQDLMAKQKSLKSLINVNLVAKMFTYVGFPRKV